MEMRNANVAEVIQTKRKPPIWAVKARGRYARTFIGPNAKAEAEAFAAASYPEFTVSERPTPGRELKHLHAAAEQKSDS
jgi:hypothetical protein